MLVNKKGVSPLIATVLLVMIVVSIGAAVMVVIQGLTEEGLQNIDSQQQLIKCGSDVDTKVLTVGTTYRICINRSSATAAEFAIQLENKGMKDISDFRFTILGDNAATIDGGTSGLTKGNIGSLKFNASNINGTIAKVWISPQIPGGTNNPIVTCSEPNLEWDQDAIAELSDCSEVTWDDTITVTS